MFGRNENATQASLQNHETAAAPDPPAYSLTRSTPPSTTKCKTRPIPGIAHPTATRFPPMLCHPERSRGTCFLPVLTSSHPSANPSRSQTAGLSTPGTNSRASPLPPLKMTGRWLRSGTTFRSSVFPLILCHPERSRGTCFLPGASHSCNLRDVGLGSRRDQADQTASRVGSCRADTPVRRL
jgi:hypothetical protein